MSWTGKEQPCWRVGEEPSLRPKAEWLCPYDLAPLLNPKAQGGPGLFTWGVWERGSQRDFFP